MNLEQTIQQEPIQKTTKQKEYTIHVSKDRIIKAFDNVTFGMFKEFNPKPKYYGEKYWTKWYIEEIKKLDCPAKEDIAILTGLVNTLRQSYYCLWQPFRIPPNQIDDSFFKHEFIKESYDEMGKEHDRITEHGLMSKANPEYLKTYYETLYGYYIAKKMIMCVDDVFLTFVTCGYPICTRGNTMNQRLWLRYNNVSVRGTRRVKMWDTFVESRSMLSRRARPGYFYNLFPRSLQILDSLDIDEDKVPFLFAEIEKKGESCQFQDAIHPHISNREPCLGGWESKLISVAQKGYSELFFKAIRGFLCTWSRESPFWNINQQFYKTFTFHDEEKNKDVKIHWSPVDSMYVLKNHSALWTENLRYREMCARILSGEKAKTGIYTTSTVMILKRMIRDMKKTCAGEILSKMHELPYIFGNSREEDSLVLENPYYIIEDFVRNHFVFNISGANSASHRAVPLDRMKSKVEFRTIVNNVMFRAQMIADELWYKEFGKMSFEEVRSYNKLAWESETYTKEQFKAYYLQKWMRHYEDLSEEDYLMHNFSKEEEEDLLTLKLMLNPEVAAKQINEWKKQSLSSSVTKINKEKEEYVNELAYLSNYPEQGQLFSG